MNPMQEGEIHVWSLLDEEDVSEAIETLDAQITQTQADLMLAAEVASVLDQVQLLLEKMQGLAQQACKMDADRPALHAEFVRLRNELDALAAAHRAAFAPSDAARLHTLLAQLEKERFDSTPDTP